MSFPAAALSRRLKAGATILFALILMVVGCAVMLVAANIEIYGLVLFGLFILASGITLLQVAANPLAAALGRPDRSHFRLTLSQTFNSFGTFLGPYLGATLFLKGVEVKHGQVLTADVRDAALAGIDRAFFWIGGLIVVLLVFMALSRRRIEAAVAPADSANADRRGGSLRDAFASRWAVLGAAAIFLYVGAEVSIGTQMALLLNDDDILGLPLDHAGKMVSLYWGGAMVGRLIGTVLLTRVEASRILLLNAAGACILCIYVVAIGGPSAGYAALAIGLFNSIMFPVIFTLTLERSAASSEATSGLLCFAIIGGAMIPPLTGLVSEASTYATALMVPAVCYALLGGFAIAAGRSLPRRGATASQLAH